MNYAHAVQADPQYASVTAFCHTNICRLWLCLFLGRCWRKETKAHKLYLPSRAFSTNIQKTATLLNLVNILSREGFRKSVCSRNLKATSALFPRCNHTSHKLPHELPLHLSHRAKHPFSEEILEKSRRLLDNNYCVMRYIIYTYCTLFIYFHFYYFIGKYCTLEL